MPGTCLFPVTTATGRSLPDPFDWFYRRPTDYDAFGNRLHITDTTANVDRSVGEQWDPDLNLCSNRARYLNAVTGRFITVDPYGGDRSLGRRSIGISTWTATRCGGGEISG